MSNSDFVEAKKSFEQHAGRKVTDDEFNPLFFELEQRFAIEALHRIDQDAEWSVMSDRVLRAIQRYGKHMAACIAQAAAIDLGEREADIEATARDDERLREALRAMLVEYAAQTPDCDPVTDGFDVTTAVISYAAASIRARIELNNRSDETAND